MVNASLRGVSLSEAEDVLVTVWRRVEEYRVDAPKLRFGFGRDGSVTIRFSFSDPASAFLIMNGLDAPGSATPVPERKKPRRRVAVGAEW
ncbi:hypothetical protein [Azospirillum sp. sgz301742]